MKKLFSFILSVFIISMGASISHAAAQWHPLKTESGSVLFDTTLANASTTYSEALDVRHNDGFLTLVIDEHISGGTGDIDVDVEYSIDGITWFDVCYVPTPMDGTCTQEGLLLEAYGNDTDFVPVPIRLTRYVRFKFEPDADSEISAWYIYYKD